MKEGDIIEQALANLNQALKVKGNWVEFPNQELDAYVTLYFPVGQITFATEVKYEVRESFLRNFQQLAKDYPNFLLVVYRLYPKYKKFFQEMGINYLEANGNASIQKDGIYVLIDQYPPLKEAEKEANRAFTKAGLRVFFQLLVSNENLFATQRELAEQAGVALGNIPLVLKGLKTMDILLKKNSFGFQWFNKEEAISHWINGYQTTLKPGLFLGRFSLPKEMAWKDIILPNPKTCWGGEPGGDILTNYIRPEKLTLFTDLNKPELIKATRLIPDSTGEIEVYETFWEKGNEKEKCAPPLLVYADLIINGDKRSLEIAKMIYDQYLAEL